MKRKKKQQDEGKGMKVKGNDVGKKCDGRVMKREKGRRKKIKGMSRKALKKVRERKTKGKRKKFTKKEKLYEEERDAE